jgi:transposase InsO family protein
MSQRLELVTLARATGGPGLTQVCGRFGVSRKTAYKWLARLDAGDRELSDRSRRPLHSPARCRDAIEQQVVQLRREHPAWGPRKLRQYLLDQSARPPAASTIGRILHRHGLITSDAWQKHTAYQRFEYPEPNDLWQMDFKGHFVTAKEGKCHPLCVLDDHSRYALCVHACGNEESGTVQGELTALFRTYGLPAGILADNGSAWSKQTKLAVWLMRLGLRVLHGRPSHPQTQGKLERFNRTLKAEAIGCSSFADLRACQTRFDCWRHEYNHRRPHEALAMATPASRYHPSKRSFPETLPAIEYGPGDEVLTVNGTGMIGYGGRRCMVGQAYSGLPVALRPVHGNEAIKNVYFCQQKVAELDLRAENP